MTVSTVGILDERDERLERRARRSGRSSQTSDSVATWARQGMGLYVRSHRNSKSSAKRPALRGMPGRRSSTPARSRDEWRLLDIAATLPRRERGRTEQSRLARGPCSRTSSLRLEPGDRLAVVGAQRRREDHAAALHRRARSRRMRARSSFASGAVVALHDQRPAAGPGHHPGRIRRRGLARRSGRSRPPCASWSSGWRRATMAPTCMGAYDRAQKELERLRTGMPGRHGSNGCSAGSGSTPDWVDRPLGIVLGW